MAPGKGGSILVHVGTNNKEKGCTTYIVRKYRQLVRILNGKLSKCSLSV